MRFSWSNLCVFTVALGLLTACGGGGSDSGNGSDTGPDTTDNKQVSVNKALPLAEDLRWIYNTDREVYVDEKFSSRGETVYSLHYPTGGKEYYISEPDGIDFAGFYSPSVRVSGAGEFSIDIHLTDFISMLRESWIAGVSIPVDGRGTVNIQPTYGEKDVNYSGNVMYFGEETLTTPAGEFTAHHISIDVSFSANVENRTISLPLDVEFWLSDNVGIVRRFQSNEDWLLEKLIGTDSDSDGVPDRIDSFPEDPQESSDADGDGIGDNADNDDDNDGIVDAEDPFPYTPVTENDIDGDGISNNNDSDDDNDGFPDDDDAYPQDPNLWEKLDATPQALAYHSVWGTSEVTGSQSLQITGANINWRLVEFADWISIEEPTGIGEETVSINVDATALSLGEHTQTVELENTDTGEKLSIPVTINVALPEISLEKNNLALDAQFGWTTTQLSQTATLNTGSNSYPVSAHVEFPLTDASSAATSGPVDENGAEVTVTFDPVVMEEGTHNGKVTLTADVKGELITAEFELSLQASAHVIFVPDNGVGLSSLPSHKKLTHSVTVLDSYGVEGTDWVANSNQSWLTVTASGKTGEPLTLSADTDGLTEQSLHFAEVTVTSPNATVENTETIRVALWVGDTDPEEINKLDLAYTHIKADPLRPLVYVHDKGNTLYTYHMFTQSLVTSTEIVDATQLGNMDVSSDGSELYVIDDDSGNIHIVDLDQPSNQGHWELDESVIAYGRPKGQPVLITAAGNVIDTETGIIYPQSVPTLFYGATSIDVSLQGNRYCSMNSGLSPYTLSCYNLSYSTLSYDIQADSLGSAPHGTGSNGSDVAVSNDGATVYAASGAPYEFTTIDTDTMSVSGSLGAAAYPVAVEMGIDGQVWGASGSWYGPLDIWIYDDEGNLLKEGYISGYANRVLRRALTVSADGVMGVVSTDDPYLVFFRAY